MQPDNSISFIWIQCQPYQLKSICVCLSRGEFQFVLEQSKSQRKIQKVFIGWWLKVSGLLGSCCELLHFSFGQSKEFPALLCGEVCCTERLVEFLGWIPIQNVKVKATAMLFNSELYVCCEKFFADAEFSEFRLHVKILEEKWFALPCGVSEEADSVADKLQLICVVFNFRDKALEKWIVCRSIKIAIANDISCFQLWSTRHFFKISELLIKQKFIFRWNNLLSKRQIIWWTWIMSTIASASFDVARLTLTFIFH